MKSYTDLEQSKKLAEILPVESADMYYKYVLPKSDKIIHTPEIGNPIDSLKWYNEGYTFRGKREPITLSEYCIPCWSLAALLSVLNTPDLTQTSDGGWFIRTWYLNHPYNVGGIENPVDACVEMIMTLKELKLL